MSQIKIEHDLATIALRPLHFSIERKELATKFPNWEICQTAENVYKISFKGKEMGTAKTPPNGCRTLEKNIKNLAAVSKRSTSPLS